MLDLAHFILSASAGASALLATFFVLSLLRSEVRKGADGLAWPFMPTRPGAELFRRFG